MWKLRKEDINLSNWDFEFRQRNKNCVLMADLHCRGLYYNLKEEIKLDIDRYDYIFTNFDKGYVNRYKKNKLLKLLRKASIDSEYLKYIFKNSLIKMQDLNQTIDYINLKIKAPVKNNELIKFWEKFEKSYMKAMPWFYIPWYLSEENILTNRVKNMLNKYVKDLTDLDEALGILIFPIKKVAFQEEQDLFFDLVEFAQNNINFEKDKKFKDKMKIYLDKFSFFPTFYFLPIKGLDEATLIKNIKEAIKNNFEADFKIKVKMQAENSRKIEKLMQVIKKDKKLIKSIELARELGYILTASVDKAHKAGSKFDPFLRKLAQIMSIKREDIIYMTSEEIKNGLKNNKVSGIDFKERKVGQICAFLEGKSFAEFGDKAIEISKWIETSTQIKNLNVSEFKGQSASKGCVYGKVRIAFFPKDSYELKEGEVLVCSMTSPDYVPAMKRAKAIITDEGGLLSHAAIMSREFGKPCIIGTKIATKILKDGMMVEVDADKGIVRIINKK
jgi:phosphohistidine swiveling domain-containing protein